MTTAGRSGGCSASTTLSALALLVATGAGWGDADQLRYCGGRGRACAGWGDACVPPCTDQLRYYPFLVHPRFHFPRCRGSVAGPGPSTSTTAADPYSSGQPMRLRLPVLTETGPMTRLLASQVTRYSISDPPLEFQLLALSQQCMCCDLGGSASTTLDLI